MELKALAGDRDLYDVMKKRERQQRKTQTNNRVKYEKEKLKEKKETSVFDFINKKLHGPHPKKGGTQ